MSRVGTRNYYIRASWLHEQFLLGILSFGYIKYRKSRWHYRHYGCTWRKSVSSTFPFAPPCWASCSRIMIIILMIMVVVSCSKFCHADDTQKYTTEEGCCSHSAGFTKCVRVCRERVHNVRDTYESIHINMWHRGSSYERIHNHKIWFLRGTTSRSVAKVVLVSAYYVYVYYTNAHIRCGFHIYIISCN